MGLFSRDVSLKFENIEIPNEVWGRLTKLSYTFQGTAIEEITIPEGITSLNDTFYNCSELKKVNLPHSCTILDGNVFKNCTSLESIKIPQNVQQISWWYEGCFYGCTNLKEIIWEENSKLKLLGPAFDGCSSLTEICLPAETTNLRAGTFKNCSNLRKIYIPKSCVGMVSNATYYSDRTFYGANSNLKIYCEGSISEYSFPDYWNCYTDNNESTLSVTYNVTREQYESY